MQDVLASQQATLHSIARALDNFKKIGRAEFDASKDPLKDSKLASVME